MKIYCDCTMGCKKCGRENTLPIIDVQKLMDENQAQNYLRLREENKRLRGALESIAKGMVIVPPNEQVEGVVGYFVGFAEAVLKGKGT